MIMGGKRDCCETIRGSMYLFEGILTIYGEDYQEQYHAYDVYYLLDDHAKGHELYVSSGVWWGYDGSSGFGRGFACSEFVSHVEDSPELADYLKEKDENG